MNPQAVYAEADALIATLKDDDARERIKAALAAMGKLGVLDGPEDYLRQTKKFIAESEPHGPPVTEAVAKTPGETTTPPAAEATVPRATAPRRGSRGMCPEVKEAMFDAAYHVYRYAELRADQNDLFTCGRVPAMKALRVSNGSVGTAIQLHLAAGVWRRDQPGQWRWKGGKGPRQTIYQLVRDFDRARAIQVYQAHRKASKAELRQRRQAGKLKPRASSVTDTPLIPLLSLEA